jgi:hypothetical protein
MAFGTLAFIELIKRSTSDVAESDHIGEDSGLHG